MEMLVFTFLRAHRENKFDLYVGILEKLMGFFFVLDHYNYARWGAVHVRDMKALADGCELKNHWVASKTRHRFSNIPRDQVHEQENAKVKGKGSAIHLTENPTAFRRWMICGPEIAKVLEEFETQYGSAGENNAAGTHHTDGQSLQNAFHQQTHNLLDIFIQHGNPFEDDGPELIVLDTRNCADQAVVDTVRSMQNLGTKQYQQFVSDIFVNQSKSIHDTIKRNSLPLLHSKPKAKSRTSQQLTAQNNNANLFGRLFIANQVGFA